MPGTQAFAAIVEVDTTPGKLYTVAARIAEDPHVVDVVHLTGPRDLLVFAGFADHAQLARTSDLALPARRRAWRLRRSTPGYLHHAARKKRASSAP